MNRFRLLILCVLVIALGGLAALFLYNERTMNEQKIRLEQLAKEEVIQRQKLELELLRNASNKKTEPEAPVSTPKDMTEAARIQRLEEENALLRQRTAASQEEAMLITEKTRKERETGLQTDNDIISTPLAGKIESYSKENNLIIFTPTGNTPFKNGDVLSVRRHGAILIDIIIEEFDPTSNKYIAEAKRNTLFDSDEKNTLKAGDEVIVPPPSAKLDLPDLSKPTPMESVEVPMYPADI